MSTWQKIKTDRGLMWLFIACVLFAVVWGGGCLVVAALTDSSLFLASALIAIFVGTYCAVTNWGTASLYGPFRKDR